MMRARGKLVRVVGLVAIAGQLSGCVAVAVPIVAAAAMGRSRLKKAGAVDLRAAKPPRLPRPAPQARLDPPEPNAVASAPMPAPVPTPMSAPAPVAAPEPAPVPAPVQVAIADPLPPPMASAPATATTPVDPAPPAALVQPKVAVPSEAPLAAAGPLAPADRYTPFVSFALEQHRVGTAGEARASVVLAPGSSLERPLVVPCDQRPTAVVVDADQIAGGVQLSNALKRLRTSGVIVLWTADGAKNEAVFRQRLAAAGIDMANDRLLIPGPAAPRKQVARQLAAVDHCIVAVLGARRGDMDELYDYLKKPKAAFRLDVLWDAGWFLLPQS